MASSALNSRDMSSVFRCCWANSLSMQVARSLARSASSFCSRPWLQKSIPLCQRSRCIEACNTSRSTKPTEASQRISYELPLRSAEHGTKTIISRENRFRRACFDEHEDGRHGIHRKTGRQGSSRTTSASPSSLLCQGFAVTQTQTEFLCVKRVFMTEANVGSPGCKLKFVVSCLVWYEPRLTSSAVDTHLETSPILLAATTCPVQHVSPQRGYALEPTNFVTLGLVFAPVLQTHGSIEKRPRDSTEARRKDPIEWNE